MADYNPNIYNYIVSIDIGVRHLALLLLETEPQTHKLHDIIWFELIDITAFQHLDDNPTECKLPHTRTFADWLSHIFLLHHELFDIATTILIERQPPQGFVVIEQLLFFHYRNKAVLVHPRSVHSWLGWRRDVAYEQRKVKSVQYLKYHLTKSSRTYLCKELEGLTRQHDVADAFGQAMFFLHGQRKELETQRVLKERCERKPHVAPLLISMVDLDKYKYIQ